MSGITDDQAYLLSHRGLQGVQVAAVAATPLYLLQSIRKGRFSMRGLASYNWVVPILGGAIGAAAGWGESIQLTTPVLAFRVAGVRASEERMRRDDFHLIGSVVGALTLPALLLRRVGLINGLLGGAGLGGAVGVLSFYGKRYADEGKLPDLPLPESVSQK
ncbi:unnamed protein product [Malassezia sympodialis ATCC 42132]|uniref:Uncharacterized protein n=1 Tax=Malassezia sympodialis (strain ATCC 42132) TaxID=1230383 RepID=M5EBP1_MALS4|nr:uncharacterized protein MSY001_3024 [Malassezia sympodialis ATCC 42132]CCV00319.1 unnamed protein product [Malassezia sympodialis ATCC 42132]SHO78108.1 Uncharacterized protein MSYG_2450 [Malassezia sympodialis ATCC 42132]|eukprot:XP_018741523.1 uncharacterized protein MSY001_3024 [Malassezia sympodialis ATCC 42132]